MQVLCFLLQNKANTSISSLSLVPLSFLVLFFLPIFKCNFVQVLKPPDAHLNLISIFSSSITASNNVECARDRINSALLFFL